MTNKQKAWQIFVVSGVLVLLALYVTIMSVWLLVALILSIVLLLIIIVLFRRFNRWAALHFDGYFIGYSQKINHRCIYEERDGKEIRSVPLKTVNFELGCDYVVVPSNEDWNKQAPEWAQKRRDEIFNRVLKKQIPCELPQDWHR